MGVDYLVVGFFGLFVSAAELTSRYRDAPGKALLTIPALLYATLNIAASLFALVLIRAFGWDLGVNGSEVAPTGDPMPGDAVWWTRILVAGVGAMALLRSALFTVRVGDRDVGVGPGELLQIVLDAADRAVDRSRARQRAVEVNRIMQDVSFDRANEALPAFCFAVMQNVTAEEQQAFANQVSALATSEMDDRIKALNLGLALMNVVGEAVLAAAVDSLADDIREPAAPPD